MFRAGNTPFRQGLFLSVASVLLTLAAAEVVFRFMSLGTKPHKVTVPTVSGYMQCYRPGNPALPIDLAVPVQRAAVSRILYAGDGRAFDLGATRCVTYDLPIRRRGTHPERGRQVAIVGDSFAFGEGVADSGTIGVALAEVVPAVGFRNLAVMGADSRDMKQLVDRALEDPRPPTDIVYFYNLNDVRRTSEMRGIGGPALLAAYQRLENVGAGFVGRHSALWRFAEQRWADLYMSRVTTQLKLEWYFDPTNASGVDQTWADVRAMVASARARGVDFWFVIYPWMSRDLFGRYPFEAIHRAVMHACESWGGHCIDGKNAFDHDRRAAPYIVDRYDEHPNAVAQRKMAEYLASIPSFLGGGRSEAAPVAVNRVSLPVESLSPRSPEVTEEDVMGPIGEHHLGGALLSFEVEPAKPMSYVLTLRASATPCRDEAGGEWPTIEVFLDATHVASMTVKGERAGEFVSAPFAIEQPSRIEFVLRDDYETAECHRSVRVETFGIVAATTSPP
jgi:hypothetical protein